MLQSIYAEWPNLTVKIPATPATGAGNENQNSNSTAAAGGGKISTAGLTIDTKMTVSQLMVTPAKTDNTASGRQKSSKKAQSGPSVNLVTTFACDVDVSSVSFSNCRAMRNIGFSLVDLRDSHVYDLKALLSAEYSSEDFKLFRGMNLTAETLRAANYSVAQCAAAGYDLFALHHAGYSSYDLAMSGLYSNHQMKQIGCDVQKMALMTLFDATEGKYWKHKSNWGSNRPVVEWFGVQVDNNGIIIRLDLRSNYLKGRLPEGLALLTSLQYIDLYNNELEGGIPELYFQRLTDLRDLWLVSNKDLIVDRAKLKSKWPKCKIRF